MSFYGPVTAARLTEFLTRLSREYTRPARIFLVGGTSLLLDGAKNTTKDIDIVVQLSQPNDARFPEVVQRLRHQMNMAIEEVSPGDYIPLPSGSDERHVFVGQWKQLTVFKFDPVSTALAKIARSGVADTEDVIAMIEMGLLNIATLESAFHEILPSVEAGGAILSATSYRMKMEQFVDEFAGTRGQSRTEPLRAPPTESDMGI